MERQRRAIRGPRVHAPADAPDFAAAPSGLRLFPKKKSSRFHSPPLRLAYTPSPSLPPRGRCLDRLGRVGRERRPRRSGPARRLHPAGRRPRPSRGSPPPPLRHYDRSALEAEKVWNGDLQTPCGSAGEARVTSAAPTRRSLTPRPVPDPSSGRRIGHGRMANSEWRTGCSKLRNSPFATHHSPPARGSHDRHSCYTAESRITWHRQDTEHSLRWLTNSDDRCGAAGPATT
jgi:hypothetical protein